MARVPHPHRAASPREVRTRDSRWRLSPHNPKSPASSWPEASVPYSQDKPLASLRSVRCCGSLISERPLCTTKYPRGSTVRKPKLYRRLDPARLPKHIAIIMDGNGRWAKRRHMPRVAGHRAGVTAVRSTVETAARIHIPALTLYAFSEENWKKRPKSEVGFLMGLLSRYLKAEVPTLNKNNIRLEYIGRQHELPDDVQERMAWAREATSRNSGMVLTLALNYSARSELVDAFRSMVNAASQNGGIEHLRDR